MEFPLNYNCYTFLWDQLTNNTADKRNV